MLNSFAMHLFDFPCFFINSIFDINSFKSNLLFLLMVLPHYLSLVRTFIISTQLLIISTHLFPTCWDAHELKPTALLSVVHSKNFPYQKAIGKDFSHSLQLAFSLSTLFIFLFLFLSLDFFTLYLYLSIIFSIFISILIVIII